MEVLYPLDRRRLHDGRDDALDVGEAARTLTERKVRDLVGGVHGAGQRAARAARLLGEAQAPEGLLVGLAESDGGAGPPVDALDARVPALGVAEGVLDRGTHIRAAELGLNHAVGELDHGVDLALALDEHADGVDRDLEEMLGLYDLKALVHEGGGVDGDLGAHVPRGVRERVCGGDGLELSARLAVEGAAGAGEPNAVDLARPLADEALEDGRVLGVHRDKAAGLGKGHEQVAAADDGFLVRIGEDLIRAEGLVAGVDPREADEGVHHDVDVGQNRER